MIDQLFYNFLCIFSHLSCHLGPRNKHVICIIQFVQIEPFISFITYFMKNIQDPIRTNKERASIDGIKKSPARKKSVFEPIDRQRDEELYDLCQKLTRDNWILQKQVNELKKALQKKQTSQQIYKSQSDMEDYRSINYQCYRKKASNLLSSVKYLHHLYLEGDLVKQRSNVIDEFMNNLSNGSNTVDQLLNLFNNMIQKEQNHNRWDIEELQKQSSQHQNNILRRYIVKLTSILTKTLDQFKNDLNEIKKSYIKSRQKISQQIQYYCSNYLPISKIQKSNSVNSNMSKRKINKVAKKKMSPNQNRIENTDWQKIVEERSKLREERHYQPNVAESLNESLAMSSALQNSYTMPINTKMFAKPPPFPKYKLKDKKSNLSVVNEVQCQKPSNNIITPKSNLHRETQQKNSSKSFNKRQQTPNWKSYRHSPNKNHYR